MTLTKKILVAILVLTLCGVNVFGGYLYGRRWVDMQMYAAGYDDGFYSSKALLVPNTTLFDATTGKTFKIIEVTKEPQQ